MAGSSKMTSKVIWKGPAFLERMTFATSFNVLGGLVVLARWFLSCWAATVRLVVFLVLASVSAVGVVPLEMLLPNVEAWMTVLCHGNSPSLAWSLVTTLSPLADNGRP